MQGALQVGPMAEGAAPNGDLEQTGSPWLDLSDQDAADWERTGWFASDQRGFLLALHRVEGLGPRRIVRACAALGGPEEVWRATESVLAAIPGLTPRVAAAVAASRPDRPWEAEAERLGEAGVKVTFIPDAAYPARLRQLADPPLVLYHRGSLPDWSRAVAVVGTRRSSPYGETQARRMGRDLAAAGALVLSGMARGIDAAAHAGALDAGGATAAILGCSPEIAYPPENRALAERLLASGGCLLSEFPPPTPPLAWRFPARNRLVARVARAVVVVEAPDRSGACITATLAADFGTEVMVIPGPADSERFAGSHRLLREGATFVRHAADVLADLGWLAPRPGEAEGAPGQLVLPVGRESLSPTELAIWQALSPLGDRPDGLASRLGLPVAEVTAALTILQVKELVVRQPGPTYHRIQVPNG